MSHIEINFPQWRGVRWILLLYLYNSMVGVLGVDLAFVLACVLGTDHFSTLHDEQ
jgi:hypothetical protein